MSAARLLLMTAALAAGCASVPPPVTVPVEVPVPVEVRVPVPVPCVRAEDLPALPALASERELAALADYDLLLEIERQRRLLAAYAARADARLQACARLPQEVPR